MALWICTAGLARMETALCCCLIHYFSLSSAHPLMAHRIDFIFFFLPACRMGGWLCEGAGVEDTSGRMLGGCMQVERAGRGGCGG